MKSKNLINIKLLVLGACMVFCHNLTAQRVTTETELSKEFPLADKAWAQKFAENFSFTFNYTLDNVKDFKDYSVIKKTALEGERKFYQRAKINMPTQITTEAGNVRELLIKKDLMVSDNLRKFYTQILDSLAASLGPDDFSTRMIRLKRTIAFTDMIDSDKKMASTFILCLDYTGQVMPLLIGKLEAKPGIQKSVGKNGTVIGSDCSVFTIQLNNMPALWKKAVKCAIASAAGAAAGGLAGAAAGAVIVGVGATAGMVVGALAGMGTAVTTSPACT